MRFRTCCATFALFALIAMPGNLRAQDDAAVTARYEAALEWWNWIRDGEFEKAAERLNQVAIAQGGNAAMIEQAVAQVAAQVGDLISLEPKRQEMQQGFHVVIMTAVYTNGTFDAQVVMADDHTVAGFFLLPPT